MIIELLLAFGADIDTKDCDGKSAYDDAYEYHYPAQLLFEKIKNSFPEDAR
jgi:ankyrin repeat protein